MNNKLENLFNLFKNLRVVQEIVEEILTLDYYVYNFDEEESIRLIDYCLTKYNREISCNELANKMERQELSKISLDAEKCFNIIV